MLGFVSDIALFCFTSLNNITKQYRRLELIQQRHEDGPVRYGEISLDAAAGIKQAGVDAGTCFLSQAFFSVRYALFVCHLRSFIFHPESQAHTCIPSCTCLLAGNILIGSKEADVIISDTAREAREKQERLIQVFEEKRRMGQVVVPTDHARVKQVLRKLGEPITLFGEREAERRDRLKALLAALSDDQVLQITGQADLVEVLTSTVQVQQSEVFYTEGSPAVRDARFWLAQYSLDRARRRVEGQRAALAAVPWPEEQARRDAVLAGVSRAALEASEVADERPVSCCAFSADGAAVISGGWTGAVKVWATQGLAKALTVRAHEERVTGLAAYPIPDPAGPLPADAMDVDETGRYSVTLWRFVISKFRPPSTLYWVSGNESSIFLIYVFHAHLQYFRISTGHVPPLFATASADRTARLWSRRGTCLATLGGHEDRLARLAFHPSGRFLATASFDQTWRLWDIEHTRSVIQQGESHAAPIIGDA